MLVLHHLGEQVNYEAFAEQIFTEARPIGGKFWLELDTDERLYWIAIARAAEKFSEPELDEWCPNCEELEDQVRDLQDVIVYLEGRLEKVRETVAQLRPLGER